MIWTQSNTLALAQQSCVYCYGLGMLESSKPKPCNCVLRAVFRACYNRFRSCAYAPTMATAHWEHDGRPKDSRFARTYGFRREEFIADFILVARRALGAVRNSLSWQLFKYHFLLGADWKLCCRKLGMDRGDFFHEVYRVQQKVGRALFEVKPYALFPLDEYFGLHRRTNGYDGTQASTPAPAQEHKPVSVPLSQRVPIAAGR